MIKKAALSIAGSDSSGGAGIQADLKAFSFLDVHGATVITCVTAQNTKNVRSIFKIPVEMIEQQIDMLYEDFSIASVKTGMLYDEEIIQCVSQKISQYKMKPVVDPVMVATSGDALSTPVFVHSLKKDLLPKTYLLTANIPEAEKILGIKIETCEEMEKSCKKLYDLGPKHILVKGGHLHSDDATDVYFDGKHTHMFSLPRIPKEKIHGTGCALSALITGFLALEDQPLEAVRKAKFLLWNMIHESCQIGRGAEILEHSPRVTTDSIPLFPTYDHFCVWLEVKTAVSQLISFLPTDFIPEVGLNIGYALPYATQKNEVCALDGRLVKTSTNPACCNRIGFGVSKHIASVVLAVMSFDPTFRCAVNLRYSKETVDRCTKIGFEIGMFDRANEPSTATSTMEWGTKTVISSLRLIPDVIYDTGGIGKEPMIRVLGKTPHDVLRKVQKILG